MQIGTLALDRPSDEGFTSLSAESTNERSGGMFGAMCHEFSFMPIAQYLPESILKFADSVCVYLYK
jgi:hypothetical protein